MAPEEFLETSGAEKEALITAVLVRNGLEDSSGG